MTRGRMMDVVDPFYEFGFAYGYFEWSVMAYCQNCMLVVASSVIASIWRRSGTVRTVYVWDCTY
jgi:hypothetical protein